RVRLQITERSRRFRVSPFDLHKLEASLLEELVNLAVQTAAAGHPLPYRIEAVLPDSDFGIWRAAMLDEDQVPVSLQDPLHFLQRCVRVRNRTERPCGDDGVHGAIRQRDPLCGTWQEFDREGRVLHSPAPQPPKVIDGSSA